MITLKCEVYQTAFDVKPYRSKTARFCSPSCGGKWHMANRVMRGPSLIGNTLRKGLRPANAFTSEEVSGSANSKWVEPIKLQCACCSTQFETKPWILRQNKSHSGYRFCSDECRRTFMRGDKDVRYVGGPVTYRGRGWIAARKLAVERDSGTCQECAKHVGDSIPVHHKVPYREFSTPAEANQISNLVCLCQSCHMKIEGFASVQSRPA